MTHVEHEKKHNQHPHKEVSGSTISHRIKTVALWGSFSFVLVAVVASSSYFIFAQNYKNRFYPGVSIAGRDVSGLMFTEALDMVSQPVTTFEQEGLQYRWKDYDVFVNPTVGGGTDSFSFEFITFDDNATVDEAYAVGRDQDFWRNIQTQLMTLVFKKNVDLMYGVDDEQLTDILQDNFKEFEIPAEDAKLSFADGAPAVQEEKYGSTFDYPELVRMTHRRIRTLDTAPVELAYITDTPQITVTSAREATAQARAIVDVAPITLTYEDQTWSFDGDTLQDSLAFSYVEGRGVLLTVSSDPMREYLDTVADDIDVEKKEGKFEVKADGSLAQIQEGQNGLALDVNASMARIDAELIANHAKTVALVVKETKPEFTSDSVKNLSIREKLGEGKSNFAGSPANRIHNIRHGSDKLNGLLIAPDQEFSLVKALRPFTLADGWKEELVIKGNKTIPEVGGGGCQLGTTMFRSAMSTGLPVTGRKNHSYSVSYYTESFDGGPKVAGTDATIYDPGGDNPQPDMRFINDTGNYILLQTRIEGTEMTFAMWGTGDGRVATRTKPVNYDYAQPPPRKDIETTDLAPGEVKCIERAHVGLSASFDYTVKYADGEVKTQNFTSKYKPWQEICMVGVDPNKAKPAEGAPAEGTEVKTE